MANAPIQVILNAESFRRDRIVPTPASAGKDFFKGDNASFAKHKARLSSKIAGIQSQLIKSGSGFAKVTLRPDAVAKSHHPVKAVFNDAHAPSIGGGGLGVLIAKLDSTSIKSVQKAIDKAELTIRERVNTKTGELEPAPSRYRCEVGAIDDIQLWAPGDRRTFDLEFAVKWLTNPRTGHAYRAELFEPIAAGEQPTSATEEPLAASFIVGLRKLGLAISLQRLKPCEGDVPAVLLTLRRDADARLRVSDRPEKIEYDGNVGRHSKLVSFLENHPLVRRIVLSSSVERSATGFRPAKPLSQGLPLPARNAVYPRVGIIDGGLGSAFKKWIIWSRDFLAEEHQCSQHGSFIGGLLINGHGLNTAAGLETDGCMVADINIFPSEDIAGSFEKYFHGGVNEFFNELESAVKICRDKHGIRIFNLSLNMRTAVSLDHCSPEARRLDRIAIDHDVIFVISAGNLAIGSIRQEWPEKHVDAATILAAHRDDQLYAPAESVRNLSVAAINPEGLSNSIGGALARYSRRGPGLRAGVKPDLCHVGGSGTVCPKEGHGLRSRTPDGKETTSFGTSYAAPLVARTLASIEAQIEGAPSRETLIALLIHQAKTPKPLQHKMFQSLSRQLVGFGRPATAAECLVQEDHEVTLLFSSVILNQKALEFRFAWPKSLVTADGKCTGNVKLTLVSSPKVDYKWDDEFVRTNIECALQQEQRNGKFASELEATYVAFEPEEGVSELNLVEHKFKWAPIKTFSTSMPKGRGASSNWRLMVSYLTRAGESMPKKGVPFSVLLTISDPGKSKPVFQEMRQSLQASGVKLADIRTAARVTQRV